MSDHIICPRCGKEIFSSPVISCYETTCDRCKSIITPLYTDDLNMKNIREAFENEKDFLGDLEKREEKIQKSGIRDIFTPSRPVISQDLFFGTERRADMRRLIAHLNTPGQHILLYGERGVGKSSLAIIASQYYESRTGANIYLKGCDSSTTFYSLIKALSTK